MIFEVLEPLFYHPCVGRSMIFTFSRYRGKIEKVMKNGGQQVIKINEKWGLGPPQADFSCSRVDFGKGQKINDFLIDFGTAKNQYKSVLGRLKVAMSAPAGIQGGSKGDPRGGLWGRGSQGRRPIIKDIDKSIKKQHECGV